MGARSPLLAEPPLSDQTLIDHFGSLRDSADWWVALKLTGADATQENAKTVCRRLLLRLHPDKCKLPAAAEAFRKLNHFRDKIAMRPYSMSAPAHGSGIRPVVPAKPPRTATATAPGRGRKAPLSPSRSRFRRRQGRVQGLHQGLEAPAHLRQDKGEARAQAQASRGLPGMPGPSHGAHMRTPWQTRGAPTPRMVNSPFP